MTFSCNGRFCPTCGKKATDQWVNKQLSVLPDCPFQHITFTMPGALWPYFKEDRTLLNQVAKLAAECISEIAKNKKGIKVGIFTALHSFGHDLKWNIHVHLSVTMGGLDQSNQWKNIRFSPNILMKMWRYRIIKLLRNAKKEGKISVDEKTLNTAYEQHWFVHMAKLTKNANKTVSYLGRYIKRPPISMAKIKHYDGKEVTFKYIDRTDNKHKTTTFDAETFIQRLTDHIHDKNFRLIRYYGFLANCLRGNLLPIVQRLFGTIRDENYQIFWRTLFKNSFGIDPLQCILCQSNMGFVGIDFGSKAKDIKKYHQALATGRML